MAIVKIIELVGSSTSGSDDAVKQGLEEARRTLRGITAVDVVSVGLRGDGLNEWRAHLRIAILVERADQA
jgi:flavin-binding protein dodecin